MVSIGPYIQSHDYTHMFDIPDYRKPLTQFNTRAGSIMGLLQHNKDFSKFKFLVELANMEGILDDPQANCTVFVPSDVYLKDKYSDSLFVNMDRGTAKKIVQYSIIDRRIGYELLSASPAIYYFTRLKATPKLLCETVNGQTKLNGCAVIVKPNVPLNNGLIHVVDNLLITHPIV